MMMKRKPLGKAKKVKKEKGGNSFRDWFEKRSNVV